MTQLYLHRANTPDMLARAMGLGIGVEIDVRTHLGIPYLCHDAILGSTGLIPLKDLTYYIRKDTPILLDFKETGIIDIVLSFLPSSLLESSLVIDLIAPDMYYAQDKGLKTLVRKSVYEEIEPYISAVPRFHAGWWLDFVSDPRELAQAPYSSTWLVSPELHRHELTDQFIRVVTSRGFAGICTDFPERW